MSLQQDIDNLKASIDVNINQKSDPASIQPTDVGSPIQQLADILANTGSYFPAGSVTYDFGNGIFNDGSGSITLDTSFTDQLYATSGSYQASGSYLTSASAATNYQPKGNYQASGSYLTSASAASTYQPIGNYQVSGSYLSSASAASTYQPIGIYVTSASAASTYLTSASAALNYQPSGNYITSASAAATYQPSGNYLTSASAAIAYTPSGSYQISGAYQPAGNYLTSASAASTYQTIDNYLTSASAASIYLTSASIAATYLTQLKATQIYLTSASAALNYQPSGNYISPTTVAAIYATSTDVTSSLISSSNSLTGSFQTIISSSLIPYEVLSSKSNDTTLNLSSTTLYPTQNAVKTYVDNKITGISFTTNVKVASTGSNIDTGSAPSSLDSISLSNGDRILLKDQTDQTQNGIYIFAGSGSLLTRSSDANTGPALANKTVPVTSGTINTDTWWTITNSSITIGTTLILLTQTGGTGNYNATNGVLLSGNTFVLDTSFTDDLYAASGSYQVSGSYQPSGNYITSASAAASYAPSGSYQASGSYLTSASAASTYQPIGNYLTSASAASTYQPIGTYITSASVASIYVTSASAASTYQPIGTYITSASAASTYQLIGNYVTSASAASIYQTIVNTTALSSSISTVYLTSASAVLNYQIKGNYVPQTVVGFSLINLNSGSLSIVDNNYNDNIHFGSGSIILQEGVNGKNYSSYSINSSSLQHLTSVSSSSGIHNYFFTTQNGQTTIGYSNQIGNQLLSIASGSLPTFFDNITNFGIQYFGNYAASGTLNDRWIPDYGAVKAYVNSASGSYLTSASAASTYQPIGNYQSTGSYILTTALVTGDLTGSITSPTIKSAVNLGGFPTITTSPSLADNTTKLTTTAFVHNAINAITGSINNLTGSVFNLLSGSTSVTLASGNSGSGIATTAFVNNTLVDNTVYFSQNSFTGSGAIGNTFRINLTTVSSSGPATLISGTLNIPQYSGGGVSLSSNNIWTGLNTYSGSFSAVSGLAQSTILKPTLLVSASNDTLVALDITPTWPTSSFTGIKKLGLRINGAADITTNSIFGMEIINSGNNFGNIGLMSINGSGFALPYIYMGQYVTSPGFTNYIFSLDDGGDGATFNGPGSPGNNPVTFKINNITKAQITTNGVFNISTLGIKPLSSGSINSTATSTATQLSTGLITSTSPSATTITLPTATAMATQLSATQGYTFDFVIDNSAGASIVTLILGSGMTALSIITGENTLTTAIGSTGHFRLYFKSSTAASFMRLG